MDKNLQDVFENEDQGGGGLDKLSYQIVLGGYFHLDISISTLLYFAPCPWKLISRTVSAVPVSPDICWGFWSGRLYKSREVSKDGRWRSAYFPPPSVLGCGGWAVS